MNFAHGYVCVPPFATDKPGDPIEEQERVVMDYFRSHLEAQRLLWAGMYRDTRRWRVRHFDRPAGRKLCVDLQRNDHVIVASQEHGFRDIGDFCLRYERWRLCGITMHLADRELDLSSPIGIALVQHTFAYYEFACRAPAERSMEAKGIRCRRINSGKFPFIPGPCPNPPAGRIWSYLRSGPADDRETTLDGQHATITNYLNGRDATALTEQLDETLPPLHQRPAGKRLLEALQPGDHVIIARLDRLFHSVREVRDILGEWETRGIHLHLAEREIEVRPDWLLELADWQSNAQSKNTRLLLWYNQKNQLRYNRHIPFGKRFFLSASGLKRLIPDRRQFVIARYCQILRHQGLSYDKISDRLEDILAKREDRKPIPKSGIMPKRHKKLKHREWRSERVRRLLMAAEREGWFRPEFAANRE